MPHTHRVALSKLSFLKITEFICAFMRNTCKKPSFKNCYTFLCFFTKLLYILIIFCILHFIYIDNIIDYNADNIIINMLINNFYNIIINILSPL